MVKVFLESGRMDKMKTCAVAGHQPKRFKFKYKENYTGCKRLKKRLKEQFIKVYKRGVHSFVIGSALGVDVWSGEILLRLREEPEYSDIRLTIVVPFDGRDKDWDAHNKRRMEFLKRHSEVIYASNISDAASFYKRDQYLVSQADCLIAVFDGDFTVKSSVERIVRGALKKDIPTVFIHPDTAEVFHKNR